MMNASCFYKSLYTPINPYEISLLIDGFLDGMLP